MNTIVLTGATSGMGLECAKHLLQNADVNLIIGARSNSDTSKLQAAHTADRLTLLELDTSSLASVRAFSHQVISACGPSTINAISLNAGAQIISEPKNSVDGFELTFATNVLGHILLTYELLERMEPGGVIVSTASGTHDPKDKFSTSFGFRGGFFPSAKLVSKGELGTTGSTEQQGLDRYATSKLCNIMFSYAMARQIPGENTRFIAFDPGLMPGTQLARERGWLQQFAWRYVMPLLRPFIHDISSPVQSGKSLAAILIGQTPEIGSGAQLDHFLQPKKSAELSYRTEMQDELLSTCKALLKIP